MERGILCKIMKAVFIYSLQATYTDTQKPLTESVWYLMPSLHTLKHTHTHANKLSSNADALLTM